MTDQIIFDNQQFSTVVAITENEHINGLMFEKEAYIMTFPYDTLAVRKFWMENTLAPLDIIFCRNGKVVDVCKGKPFSKDFIGPNFATDLVVEMPAGTVEKCGIYLGCNVKLNCSRKTKLKKYLYNLQ